MRTRFGQHGMALLGLVALAVLLFREVSLAGRVFYARDINMWWIPQAESFVRCVFSGSWPLWDPWRGFGQPLLADPSSEVLYPFTWLHLLVPPWRLYTAFVLVHVVGSALGTYALGLRWRLSRLSAFVSAAIWLASGPMVALVCLPHHLAGAAWIPWVFVTADVALEHRTVRTALACGAVMALQILAGSADMVALAWSAVAVHAVWCRVRWDRPFGADNRSVIGSLALAWISAVGLTAAQWLPTLDVASRSARFALDAAARTTWSLHPAGLLEVVVPLRWVDLPLKPEYLDTILGFKDPWLGSIYLGVPALALVLAAAVSGTPRRRLTFLGFVAVASTLVALGRHTLVYDLTVTLLPPLAILRFPVKAMVMTAFATSCLAGVGVEFWATRPELSPRSRRVLLLALAALSLLPAAAYCAVAFGTAFWGPRLLQEHASSWHGLLDPVSARLGRSAIAAIVVLLLAIANWRLRIPRALAAVASVIVLGDLLGAHWQLNPTADVRTFLHRPEVLGHIPRDARLYVYDYSVATRAQSAAGLKSTARYTVARMPEGASLNESRVLGVHSYLNPPTATRWRLRGSFDLDLLGLYPGPLAWLTENLREREGRPLHLELLRLGSVTHVLALHDADDWRPLQPLTQVRGFFVEPIRLFAVPDPLPRVYAVGAARLADREAAFAALDAGLDPKRTVMLADAPPAPPSTDFHATVEVIAEKPDRSRYATDFAKPGYLVVTDAYDPGWHARIDGRPADVLRANVAFRAVHVPAGRHVVEIAYRPMSLWIGLMLSVVTVLVSGAAAMRTRRRGPLGA